MGGTTGATGDAYRSSSFSGTVDERAAALILARFLGWSLNPAMPSSSSLITTSEASVRGRFASMRRVKGLTTTESADVNQSMAAGRKTGELELGAKAPESFGPTRWCDAMAGRRQLDLRRELSDLDARPMTAARASVSELKAAPAAKPSTAARASVTWKRSSHADRLPAC